MCVRAVNTCPFVFESVSDRYKTQEMCDKAVDSYAYALELAPERYKTQEICDNAVNTCFFLFNSVPDRYRTQKMCDEAVEDFLAALKLIPDWWFVTSKMLEKFHDSLLANNDILFFDEDFSKVTFYADKMGIPIVDLDKISLDDDTNFYEDDPDVRLLS